MAPEDESAATRAGVLAGESFERSILITFLLLGALAIGVFAPVRAIRGDWFVAIADASVALCLLLLALWARCARQVRGVGIAVASFCVFANAFLALWIGMHAFHWAYVVYWIAFLVAPFPFALPANLLLVATLLAIVGDGVVRIQAFSFAVTSLLSILFAALFVRRFRLQRDMLAQLASYDTLTGAKSRRLFELRSALPLQKLPAVLAVLDLDRFKEANDTLGHEAGDRLLAAMGRTIRSRIRKSDEFFRYGGDEFVLILPGLSLGDADRVLEDLRGRINRALAEAGWPSTVSIGATELAHGETLNAAFLRADEALRRAKEGGRDRIALAGPNPQPSRSA